MPGPSLGSAFVQIVPSAQGIGGAISNVLNAEAGAAGDSAGGTIASRIKGAIAAAGIGAAVTAGIKTSLLEGAELEQNIGGTQAVFGKFYQDIQNKATEAYMNMGLSASDYMATANKMGSLFQGSGLSQQKSLDLTADAMQRAADVASVMGIDTTFAMESIAGAAKGNFTMMDNLGVAMNATTLQAYALEKGMNFKWDTASNAEKAELAMKMFMDRTSQYEGNFARESSETFSGSLGAMKAAAQDFAGNLSLGENVKPALQNLVTTAQTFLFENLVPALGNIFTAMPMVISSLIQTGLPQFLATGTQLVTSLAQGAQTALPGMISNLMTGLVKLSGQLRTGFSKFVDVGLGLIKSIANGIIKNIPTFIQTVPQIVTNIASLINDNAPKLIITGLSIIKSLAVGLIKAIPTLVASIPQIIKALLAVFEAVNWANIGKLAVTGISKGIKSFVGIVKKDAAKIKDGIVSAINSVPGRITSAISSIKSKLSFSGLVSKVKSTFNKAKESITRPIQNARDKVKGIVNKIKGFFPLKLSKLVSFSLPSISIGSKSTKVGDKSVKSPTFGVGSWKHYAKAVSTPYMFTRPTTFAVAGESSDEIMYGRSNLMRDISEAVGHRSQEVNMTNNITVNGAEDPEQYAQRFARELRRQVRMGAV